MKPNRVHRNGGKKPASHQSESLPKNAPGETPNWSVALGFLEGEEDNCRVGKLKISPAADYAVARFASRAGFRSYAEAFDYIVSFGLSQAQRSDSAFDALNNIENISAEVAVMFDMIPRTLHSWFQEGNPSKQMQDKFDLGLYHLSKRLEDSLKENLAIARKALTVHQI